MKSYIYLLFFLVFFSNLNAQLNPQAIQIPMRDGQNLAADLYLPNTTDTFPVILIQTPYDKNRFQLAGLPLGIFYNQAGSNYAFVIVDWRCFYGSTAACVPTPDRGNDGYDAVEWIAQQNWCNGKVGTWGPSALGNIQYQTAKKQPPSLVCALPEVASPQTNYQDYYNTGCYRLELLETLAVLFGSNNLVVLNPYYNFFWQIAESQTMYPDSINIPMFLVGGWYDHNIDPNMIMIDTLANSSGLSVRNEHKILVGPWVHGGTGPANVGTTAQGQLNFPQAARVNDTLGLQFFDYHLRNINNGWDTLDRYMYFQMGDNVWESSDVWPPQGGSTYNFYLQDDNTIQSSPPSTTSGSLSYMYDPVDPSPTIGGKTLNVSLDQGPYDQTDSVESRNDVVLFTTPFLTQDLAIKGKIKAHLYVKTDRLDTDFMLRLTEVYPDNRSMLVDEAEFRLRFRDGFRVSDTAFAQVDSVYQITLEFDHIATTFQAGQRLRLILSSSNYPRYNRNMNTGGVLHPNDNPDTLVNPLVAINEIMLNSSYPSHLELPLYNYLPNSTKEVVNSAAMRIFPNPTTGIVQVEGLSAGTQLAVFSAAGRLVQQHNNIATSSYQLDLSGLAKGMYFVQLRANNGIITKKVVHW